jgi:hypothetical protein
MFAVIDGSVGSRVGGGWVGINVGVEVDGTSVDAGIWAVGLGDGVVTQPFNKRARIATRIISLVTFLIVPPSELSDGMTFPAIIILTNV